MEKVSDEPDYGAVSPLPDEDLLQLFGTTKPTREMVDSNYDLFERLERGQGVYIIVFTDDQPSGILFAGYSFD